MLAIWKLARLNQMKPNYSPSMNSFVNYGFKSSVGKLKEWGLDLQRHKDPREPQTKRPAEKASTLVATVASTKEKSI